MSDLNRAFGWTYRPQTPYPSDSQLRGGVDPRHPSAYWTCRPEIASAACADLLRLRRSLGISASLTRATTPAPSGTAQEQGSSVEAPLYGSLRSADLSRGTDRTSLPCADKEGNTAP